MCVYAYATIIMHVIYLYRSYDAYELLCCGRCAWSLARLLSRFCVVCCLLVLYSLSCVLYGSLYVLSNVLRIVVFVSVSYVSYSVVGHRLAHLMCTCT